MATDIIPLEELAKYCHDLIELGQTEEAKEKLHQIWHSNYPQSVEKEVELEGEQQ